MQNTKILVQKFGGTSVSTPERRSKVINHVRRAREDGYKVAIVVSAMGRRGDPYATDTLLDLLRSDGENFHKRDYDMAFVCGEILSATLMAHLLKRHGIPAVGLTGGQAGFYTNHNHGEAEIKEINPSRVKQLLDAGEVPVVAGCQGVIPDLGDFTTLGRGGSDTSGVALGFALNAYKVDIFTDVNGVARADPRVVSEAKFLEHINFDSMLTMARYGAGVIHPRAVRAGRDGRTTIEVRSTFTTKRGTIINASPDQFPIVGIATLGPLETIVLEEDFLGPEERAIWEKDRLIMSLVDEGTGRLILSASSEKSDELAAAKVELGNDVIETHANHSWLSLIGISNSTIGNQGYQLLEKDGIKVFFREHADQRITYIVPSEDEIRGIHILYNEYIKQ